MVLQLKAPVRDGTTHLVKSLLEPKPVSSCTG